MTDPSSPCPDHAAALHAFVDGELDALASAAMEDHLRRCGGCRAALEQIEATRSQLAAADLRLNAPDHLRQWITGTFGAQEHGNSRPSALGRIGPWLGGGALGALAASVALLVLSPGVTEPGLADALIDGQIRSLQNGHLVDIATSDRHTVKPWFNGRITFAPPVIDLKPQGFPLVGGRLDVIDRENIAALVFHRRLHTINLFIRPAPKLSSPFAWKHRHAGYNVIHWVGGGLEFWAVSDLNETELDQFSRAFEQAAQSG